MKITWTTALPKHASGEGKVTQCSQRIKLKPRSTLSTEQSRDTAPQKHGRPLSPLIHRRLKSIAEHRREPAVSWCSAVRSMSRRNSVEALVELLGQRSTCPEDALMQVLQRNTHTPAASYTSLPPPPNTATPGDSNSCQGSPVLPAIGKNSLAFDKSGDASGRSSSSRAHSRDTALYSRELTRDVLLEELDEVHLPPIWQLGKLETSATMATRSD